MLVAKNKYDKMFLVSILVLILIVLLSVQFAYGAEYVIKYATGHPPGSIDFKKANLFKNIVEFASEGEIEVQVYPSGQLGTEEEASDAVKLGSIEVASCMIQSVNRSFSILSMPFLFENWEQAVKSLDSPVMARYKKEAEQNGYHVLALRCDAPRHITNNARPIEKPEDLEGILMRVPPLDAMISSMKALGASVQTIPSVDIYMALKTGVVEGQENPVFQIKEGHYYEVQKYLSLVGYLIYGGTLCINLDYYNALPPQYQELVDFAAKQSYDYLHWYIRTKMKEAEDFLREKMIVNEITPENHKLFAEKLKPVWQNYIKEGYFTQEDLDELRAYVEK